MSRTQHALGLVVLVALSLSAAACGDGHDGSTLATAPEAPQLEPEATERSGVAPETEFPWFPRRARGHLFLSTNDPDQTYVRYHPDPWFAYSTFTERNVFELEVRNEGLRPARNLELLVAVPSTLADGGWSVTIGNPGMVFSRLEDFPETHLNGTQMPPGPIYGPRGNACFARIEGPAYLAPGETWSVPVQVFRGSSEEFKVHFDAIGMRVWNARRHDVIAQPPLGGSEERVLDGKE